MNTRIRRKLIARLPVITDHRVTDALERYKRTADPRLFAPAVAELRRRISKMGDGK